MIPDFRSTQKRGNILSNQCILTEQFRSPLLPTQAFKMTWQRGTVFLPRVARGRLGMARCKSCDVQSVDGDGGTIYSLNTREKWAPFLIPLEQI